VEINKFLNNKFTWYGLKTLYFLSLPREERRKGYNPMCEVFPTEVSCNIPNIGAAGGKQISNGLCVLTQNIINEKMYFIFWFWYVILGFISVLCLIYRICTIVSSKIRFGLIYKTIRHQWDSDLKGHLEAILDQGQIGDWFVLYQLSKNSNSYFYREFIRELAKDLKQKPKQSLSAASGKSQQNQQSSSNNKVLSMLSLARSSLSHTRSPVVTPQVLTPTRMSMISNASQTPQPLNRNSTGMYTQPLNRMSTFSNTSLGSTQATTRPGSVVSGTSHVVSSLTTDSTLTGPTTDSPTVHRNSLAISTQTISTIEESPPTSKRSSKSSL